MPKSPPTTTPPSDRVPLTREELVAHAQFHGTRFFRAGETSLYALGANSDRRPSRHSYEVTAQEAAQFLFEEFMWEGEPVLEPYASGTLPHRVGFRYTAAGRRYRVVKRSLRRRGESA